jgi:GNAT superfamily N-acetyltransferase
VTVPVVRPGIRVEEFAGQGVVEGVTQKAGVGPGECSPQSRHLCPHLGEFGIGEPGDPEVPYLAEFLHPVHALCRDRVTGAIGAYFDFVDGESQAYRLVFESDLRGEPVRVGIGERAEEDGGTVEIAYFGLMPNFIGKGIGGALLSATISRAWEMGAARVWVHTCSLDHPQARRNYETRGFSVFRIEEKVETLPDSPLEPWQGA